jgi:enoyl-CoA hydratase
VSNTKTSSVSAPLFRLARHDDVTVVTIDRPPANALDPSSLCAGARVIEELAVDPPGAVVLTGSGAFFSGGADLRVVPDLAPADQAALTRTFNEMFAGWYHFPRPIVAAVNGHAVAGGLVLALCADYRIVGRAGQFGLTEVKVGIPFPSVAMAIVQGELTPPVVRRLVFRAELFDSRTALQLDIFDELVDDDRVLDRAIAVARELAAHPRATYEIVKQRLRASALDRGRSHFGGAEVAGQAIAESSTAAKKVLDRRSE